MNLQCQDPSDEKSSVDDAFQQTVTELGGKERIHLVGTVCEAEDASQANVFEEFVKELFNGTVILRRSRDNTIRGKPTENNKCNGKLENIGARHIDNCESRAWTADRSAQEKEVNHKATNRNTRLKLAQVAIDSPMIIFIFKHEFVHCSGNLACLKEILKDVRARTELAGVRPALLGLVSTKDENGETKLSVGLLESLIRSVFRKHLTESIWVGQFMPNKADRTLTIKKNACRIVKTSLRSECIDERNVSFSWLLPCFTRTPRERTNQAKSSSVYRQEENVEELPLKTTCMSDGQWADKRLEPECKVNVEDGNAELSPKQPLA